MSAPTFDVRAYMRNPYVMYPADLDLGTMGSLSGPAMETLNYLWTVESHALDRMRDLLVTPTHAESRVTAFLSTWAHEQHWLGATLQALLSANGRPPREPGDTQLGRILRAWDDRCRPTVAAIGTNLLNADITGAHMVTGWLDTAVVATVYRRLGGMEPALGDLMRTVGRLKDRHMAFYAPEAHNRLADAASARRVARVAVSRWRFPGTRYAGPAPARAAVAGFFADPGVRGAVAELDRTVATFPGLTGAHPVRTALGHLTVVTI
ncbi:hypothetical protein CKW39_12950 [Kocuria sp. WRN011]|uniref:hypothetical protein n=1 Tax=Kocuria sp. WRN011 TaxID=2029858 RepID=UPI000BAFEDC0|nr:hypothetical protein [Kocuria sp. WRN011]PBB07623.1 hypothetical protein CKW39_12950 [Kocuria sp. WRN011]